MRAFQGAGLTDQSSRALRARLRGRRPHGITLIEALVALMVMSFGMVALVGLMSNLRRGADLAKQRGEALRIAQAELGKMRAFSVLTPKATDPAGTVAYADTLQGRVTWDATPPDSNTTYAVERLVSEKLLAAGTTEPAAKSVRVNVTWTDRAGEAQRVTLDTVIAKVDPLFGGALSLTPPSDDVRRPADRAPVVPTAAKDLGDKTSAFKPSAGGGIAWVFDNVTGSISKICTVDVRVLTSALTAGALSGCSSVTAGYLVSGTVSFSFVSPARPASPEGSALPVHASIQITSSGHPTPAFECFDDAGTVINAVNYYCIVYGNTDTKPIWSGQVQLTGLDFGPSASQYKTCRYSADYNRDGKLSNNEHPNAYDKVSGSLARQNFLVVKGNVDCPTAPPVNPTAGIFTDFSTQALTPL